MIRASSDQPEIPMTLVWILATTIALGVLTIWLVGDLGHSHG